MLIYLKACYTILGTINSNSKDNNLQFNVPIKDKSPVIVHIIPDENRIESFHEFEVSEEMLDVLQTDLSDGKDLPDKLQTELLEMTLDISNATQKVLNLIKYYFNNKELKEHLFSVKDTCWSRDKSDWKMLPMTLYAIPSIHNYIFLNENTANAIQEKIDDNFEPFFALRHLHKAKNERNPRYKWIDATIAAEIAIKEFLIRYNSDLKPLLLEVPSPPLHKLYGTILEYYIGEKSPKSKNFFREGSEIRNQLIHKPNEDVIINGKIKQIDDKKANKYVQDIEIAIFHLLTLLYPNDPIMKKFYRPRALII